MLNEKFQHADFIMVMGGNAAESNIGADVKGGNSQRAADNIPVDNRFLKNKFFNLQPSRNFIYCTIPSFVLQYGEEIK